jgi:hypothetical protein
MNKPILALLYDAQRRGYVLIRKFDDEWFTVAELGQDYARAKEHLKAVDND